MLYEIIIGRKIFLVSSDQEPIVRKVSEEKIRGISYTHAFIDEVDQKNETDSSKT